MKLSTLILRNFHLEAQLDGRHRERLGCELELVLAMRGRAAVDGVDAEALVARLREVAQGARGESLEQLALSLGRACLRMVGCQRVQVALHRRLSAALDVTARADLDQGALYASGEDERYED